jgi:hypothetical protein
MRSGRRILLGTGLAAALAWGVGCGDSTAPLDVAGHYLLESINGSALPVTVTYQNVDFVFESGFWDLTSSSFSGELSITAMSMPFTASFGGTYSLSGSTLSVTGTVEVYGVSESFSGQISVSGLDLTMVDNRLGFTITVVFTKS